MASCSRYYPVRSPDRGWGVTNAVCATSPPQVVIGGLTEVSPYEWCRPSYSANISYGTPPYTVQWQTSGVILENYTWSITANFPSEGEHYVQVVVTDAEGAVGHATVMVNSSWNNPPFFCI